MSRHAEEFAFAADQLFDEEGDTIIQWPRGLQSLAASVTGIFEEMDVGDEVDTAERSTIIRRGRLDLRISITVTAQVEPRDRDVFIINGEHWAAERIESRDRVAGCVQSVLLVREERITTRRGGA